MDEEYPAVSPDFRICAEVRNLRSRPTAAARGRAGACSPPAVRAARARRAPRAGREPRPRNTLAGRLRGLAPHRRRTQRIAAVIPRPGLAGGRDQRETAPCWCPGGRPAPVPAPPAARLPVVCLVCLLCVATAGARACVRCGRERVGDVACAFCARADPRGARGRAGGNRGLARARFKAPLREFRSAISPHARRAAFGRRGRSEPAPQPRILASIRPPRARQRDLDLCRLGGCRALFWGARAPCARASRVRGEGERGVGGGGQAGAWDHVRPRARAEGRVGGGGEREGVATPRPATRLGRGHAAALAPPRGAGQTRPERGRSASGRQQARLLRFALPKPYPSHPPAAGGGKGAAAGVLGAAAAAASAQGRRQEAGPAGGRPGVEASGGGGTGARTRARGGGKGR